MCFSSETKRMVKYFLLHQPGQYSARAMEALEEGDEFILRYLRGGKIPSRWQTVGEWLGVQQESASLAALAEQETVREGLIKRIEHELGVNQKCDRPPIPLLQ